MKANSYQTGAVLLKFSIFIFVICLGVAGWITWQIWQSGQPLPFIKQNFLPTPTPTPTNDFLNATFNLDPALYGQRDDLTANLLMPMRQYYATRPERIGNITVEKLSDSDHSIRVTFDAINGSSQKTVSFYYDEQKRGDSSTYPTWEPGMLDNTK